MKNVISMKLIQAICFCSLFMTYPMSGQINLGATQDETAPLITNELTPINPGSGYCRFITSAAYEIDLSPCVNETFDLLIPGFFIPLTVECDGSVLMTNEDCLNKMTYVYFPSFTSSDVVLRIISTGLFPIELITFTANVLDDKISLNWQTATEVNNYGFEIERVIIKDSQLTGIVDNWVNIGFVEGHGNSNSIKEYSFIDEPILSGKYLYRLKQIDNGGKFVYLSNISVETGSVLSSPKEYTLSQNYPNPFNPGTAISYQLSENSFVTLKVFDMAGNEVAVLINEMQNIGTYNIPFDASKLSSGVYFYQLRAGEFVSRKKMILMK